MIPPRVPLAVALAVASLGCATTPVSRPAPPTPAPAAPPPPSTSAPAPEAKVDPPVHDCGQDPAKESPVTEGELGEGERLVRLINNSHGAIQARLLDADLEPAVEGTLHIQAGETGVFHVPEGVYVVRYRYGTNCSVRRGNALRLLGKNAGVEIAIHPVFDEGSKANMKRVKEPL